MSDLESADWSPVAASNNATPPAGFPVGIAPSAVGGSERESRGALKRDWNRTHTTISSTGSANAYVLTYSPAIASYINGQRWSFKANFSNTGAATVNVDTKGAIDIVKVTSAGQVALAANDIVSGQHVQLEYDSATGDAVMLAPQFPVAATAPTESIIVAVTTEAGFVAAGTAKVTFRMPYAMTLTSVKASLTTAQTSGTILTIDINESGSTVLSTKLTIDNTEKTSATAATPPVISDSALAADAEITIDIDSIGDGTAAGLKVVLIGHQ